MYNECGGLESFYIILNFVDFWEWLWDFRQKKVFRIKNKKILTVLIIFSLTVLVFSKVKDKMVKKVLKIVFRCASEFKQKKWICGILFD